MLKIGDKIKPKNINKSDELYFESTIIEMFNREDIRPSYETYDSIQHFKMEIVTWAELENKKVVNIDFFELAD